MQHSLASFLKVKLDMLDVPNMYLSSLQALPMGFRVSKLPSTTAKGVKEAYFLR